MAEVNTGQPIQVIDKAQAPLWKGQEVHHTAAAFRGKTNVAYTDVRAGNEGLFSKTAQQIEGRKKDDVQSLKHEFDLLTKLADSGATPEPKGMTISPDGKEGHLLMAQVKGVSFDKTEATLEEQKQFDEIVSQTSDAVETINNRGVLVVDINNGTFVIDGLGDTKASLTTKVVDFELGEETNTLASQDAQERINYWYSRNDYGFLIAQNEPNFTTTEDIARKVEQHLTAKTVAERFLGYSHTWNIDLDTLSVPDMTLYKTQLQQVRPTLEAQTREELQAEYQRFKAKGYDDIPESEEVYVNSELDSRLGYKISETMINITLPYLLKEKGIPANPDTVKYLQQSLSPNFAERGGNGFTRQHTLNQLERIDDPDTIMRKLANTSSTT